MTATPPPPAAQKIMPAPAAQPPVIAGQRIHFVGIGGCGMQGLARITKQAGAICTGSDLSAGVAIDALQADGFPVTLEQTAASVPAQCDMLVISAAIRPDHPEVLEAQKRGVKVVKYAQLLGQLMIGRTG